MSRLDWSDMENDLIVADYFAMLADDILGRTYSKAEHRKRLAPLLSNRSEGAIEFKHQNISAVLKGLGEDWIPGYMMADLLPRAEAEYSPWCLVLAGDEIYEKLRYCIEAALGGGCFPHCANGQYSGHRCKRSE